MYPLSFTTLPILLLLSLLPTALTLPNPIPPTNANANANANPNNDLNKRCTPNPESIPGATPEQIAAIKATSPGTDWCPFNGATVTVPVVVQPQPQAQGQAQPQPNGGEHQCPEGEVWDDEL